MSDKRTTQARGSDVGWTDNDVPAIRAAQDAVSAYVRDYLGVTGGEPNPLAAWRIVRAIREAGADA